MEQSGYLVVVSTLVIRLVIGVCMVTVWGTNVVRGLLLHRCYAWLF